MYGSHRRTSWSTGAHVSHGLAGALMLLWAASAFGQGVAPDFSTLDPDSRVLAMARSGNTLYIAGGFFTVGSPSGQGAAVHPKDGRPRPGNARVTGEVLAVAADGEGGWFIGGSFTAVGGQPRAGLAHLLADGSVDAWDPSPDGPVYALLPSRDMLLVGGHFRTIAGESRSGLAALDPRTGRAKPWNPSPSYRVPYDVPSIRTMLVRGRVVYVGGIFGAIGDQPRRNLAAVDLVTARALPWSPDPDGEVRALAVRGTSLYAGGFFWHIGSQPRKYIARLDLATGSVTPWSLSLDRVPDDPYYDGGPYVGTLVAHGNTLYLGGSFTVCGGRPRGGLAALDLESGEVTPWDPKVVGFDWAPSAYCYAIVPHGRAVYVGGSFRGIGGRAQSYAGAVDAITGDALEWNPRPNGKVDALALDGESVYLGGLFTSLWSWESRHGLAALDATTGAVLPWDPNPDDLPLTLVAKGNVVYVGGYFGFVGGQPRSGLAALDGVSGEALAWNPGANGTVWALAEDRGRVYVGGGFTTMGGQPRASIAAIDSASGSATDWNPRTNGPVTSLAVSGDRVYTCGAFDRVGGLRRINIAALDVASGAVLPWNPNPDGSVSAIAVGTDAVFAGGTFRNIGGQPRNGLAAVDIPTGAATSWDPDPRGPDYALRIEAIAVAGRTVYVGGAFTEVGHQPRGNAAAINALTGGALDWNPGADGVVWSLAASGSEVFVGGGFNRMGLAPTAGLARIGCAPPGLARVAQRDATTRREAIARAEIDPNPARSTATLRFSLPASAPVSLVVYDVLGRRVATLLERQPLEAGEHQVTMRTEGWRTGFYFCRFEVAGSFITRKLTVVR